MPEAELSMGAAGIPVAVLIDADNVAAEMLDPVLQEAARYGRPTIRRVYGNWTGTELQGWKKLLHEHALQPVQQFAYVPGKNATDTALIIDAMDLLHGGLAQVFCLVSSDSDYTRLAMRLREAGKTVIGMGRAQTPRSLVKACDRFVALDTLGKKGQKSRRPELVEAEQAANGTGSRPPPRAGRNGRGPARDGARKESGGSASGAGGAGGAGGGAGGGSGGSSGGSGGRAPPREAVDLLRTAVEDAEAEDGWADMGAVGNILYANNPDFDPRTYGKRQLVTLLESLRDFDVKRPPEGQPGAIRVRLRD
jgi:uncharacterized membrane protein YgcG/Fe-S-cluster formation regulator IscX/YfhJ